MKSSEKLVKFSGTILRTIYDAPNYKIYAVDVDKNKFPDVKLNKYKNATITGDIGDLSACVEYEIIGVETMGRYGYSYKVQNIKRNIPTDESSTMLFLSEILTFKQATVLYENYPDIIQRVRENRLDDIDLNKLKGIKEKTFAVIVRKIEENFVLSDFVIQFKGYFSLSMVRKIYEHYPSIETVIQKLRSNPYKCLCSLSGVGFKKADKMLCEIEKISKENMVKGEPPIIKFDYDLKPSKSRCVECILYILEQNENDGHTKMNLADLRKEVLSVVPECEPVFVEAMKNSQIYYNVDNVEVALRSTYEIEKKIAGSVLKAIHSEQIVWDYDIEKYRIVDDISISDDQIKSLNNVCKYNISILNGPAGVGKSFTTKAIINMLKEHDNSFILCSPTGKAAKILASYTNHTASTIHRALGYNPGKENPWSFNERNKLITDIVIVDEFSMVDIRLFNHLIDAIDFNKTKLLLIGDNAQLCSVGSGNLLHDFMMSKVIPTVTLNKVFRYSEGGLMKVATDVRLCKSYFTQPIKKGINFFGDNRDYGFINLGSDVIPKQCVLLYSKLLKSGYSIEDIQVLSSMNVGDCGTLEMNNLIQKVANPNYGSKNKISYGNITYYVGDLVIQTKNNYKAKISERTWDIREKSFYENTNEVPTAFVANGETGIVKEVYNGHILIDFDGIEVDYERPDLESINLGYSISIHKSQGSGIKVVILLTPQSHVYMLNSNLLYVGLTRMKERCFHLGAKSTIEKAISKKANLSRNTFMQDFLSRNDLETKESSNQINTNTYKSKNETNDNINETFDVDTYLFGNN